MNVFISHSWAYSDHYERLAEWIFYEEWFENGIRIHFNDTSVPQNDPIHYAPNEASLQQAINQRIAISNVLVIPTGMYATYSKWIGKEIEGAKLLWKPIVAVDPWGQKRTSSKVVEAADEAVKWHKESIINAVWRQGKGRVLPWQLNQRVPKITTMSSRFTRSSWRWLIVSANVGNRQTPFILPSTLPLSVERPTSHNHQSGSWVYARFRSSESLLAFCGFRF